MIVTFFFWSSPSIRPKKGLNFWQRPFLFGPRHRFVRKKGLNFGGDLRFWSVEMVAARWNLVRTQGGPLVQKIADP